MHFSKYLAKFFAIALLSVFVMSCGKDDNNNTVTPSKEDLASKVAGKYKGTLKFELKNAPNLGDWSQDLENFELVLAKETDELVNLTFAPMNINVEKINMGYEIPAFVSTEKVKVVKDGDTYKLDGKINAKVNAVVHGKEKELDITGSIAGPIKDGKANLQLEIKMGAMPWPLKVTYVAEIVK